MIEQGYEALNYKKSKLSQFLTFSQIYIYIYFDRQRNIQPVDLLGKSAHRPLAQNRLEAEQN